MSMVPLSGVVAAVILCGCAARSPDYRGQVSKGIEERAGRGLAPAQAAVPAIPPGVSLDDGLNEDEAVATALWNNAAFQADLAELGVARAELLEAGLLRNPILSVLFPWGPKQLEATATWPVEALWQRPRRVKAARLDAERVAENLIQHGLDLVRDVRVAYAELALAKERARLAGDAGRLAKQIAELAIARLRAGDTSELEATATAVEAEVKLEQAVRLGIEVVVVKDRLWALLGMAEKPATFEILPAPHEPRLDARLEELLKEALAARPDLRAAELAIEAAGARARWERSRILAVSALLDANEEGKEGFELGPGVAVEIPVINRNRGGVARAEAEVERAARQYVAVRQRIVLEVREAYTRFALAQDAVGHWRTRILPPLEDATRAAEKAYAAGEVSYLFVLETTRRLEQAKAQEVEVAADLRRAAAQLDRSVGNRR